MRRDSHPYSALPGAPDESDLYGDHEREAARCAGEDEEDGSGGMGASVFVMRRDSARWKNGGQ